MFINEVLLVLVVEDHSEVIKPAHLTCQLMSAEENDLDLVIFLANLIEKDCLADSRMPLP